MPIPLNISDADRAKRHVIGQQLYRLRKQYRRFMRYGLYLNAESLLIPIAARTREYESLGGVPVHRGNVL